MLERLKSDLLIEVLCSEILKIYNLVKNLINLTLTNDNYLIY